MSKQTIELCQRAVDPDQLYLDEAGDRLIKLSIQLLVRHLNFFLDKVQEKRSMATDKVLFLLEDLHLL